MLCRRLPSSINASFGIKNSKLVIRRSSGSTVKDEEKRKEESSGLMRKASFSDDGPSLGDFIGGVIPRGSTWKEYQGKLKREKGENER